MTQLDALKRFTTVVADTSDFGLLGTYQPTDATTNPSLVLRTVQQPEYQFLLQQTVQAAHKGEAIDALADRLLVRLGCEILSRIPGRVSTELDARWSFDKDASLARARRLMALYQALGIGRERVLIKIAATWEGMAAAAELEREGIHTNLTLLFGLCQAVVCADVGVRLISPFVGRIRDWHKKQAGTAWDEASNAGAADPGVRSVRAIFNYYKHFDCPTQVMAASFRNKAQITALAGCDLLTISPEFLAALAASDEPLSPALSVAEAKAQPLQKLHLNEAAFRYALNEDACASEKLAEGIRLFAADSARLDALIAAHL